MNATTTTTGVKGSLRWMAIELLTLNPDGEPDTEPLRHTKATDVWAYGMLVYELLTGDVPFANLKNDFLVAMEIINGQKPSDPPSLSTRNSDTIALWSICQSCWERAPTNRPAIEQISNDLLLNNPTHSSNGVVPSASGRTTQSSAVHYVMPVGASPRVYAIAAGHRTSLTVDIAGQESVTMRGNGDEWMQDNQGQTVHYFGYCGPGTSITFTMLCNGTPHDLWITSPTANSIKLSDGESEKVVVSWSPPIQVGKGTAWSRFVRKFIKIFRG